MYKYVRLLILSKTALDSSIMLGGAVVATIIGFFITILFARNLNQVDLGITLTSLTFTQLLVDLFEIGISASLLNFIPKVFERKDIYLKTTFLIRLIVGLVVAMMVILFAGEISNIIFKNTQMIPFVKVSAIGFFFLTFITWSQTVFQAEKKFLWTTISGGLINVLRVGGLLALIFLGIFNIFNSYLLMQVILGLAIVIIFLKLGLGFLKTKVTAADFKSVLLFGLPVGLGFSLAALYTRLDQIFIFQFSGPREAGVYGLAFRVAAVLIFASSALGAATIPRFSALEKNNFKSYFKKTIVATLGLSLLSLIGILVAPPFLLILFGEKFSNSITPFQILGVGMIFFIMSSPFYNAIIFFLKKPSFSLWNSLISLIVITFLLYILIPAYGSIGAAFSVAALYLLQFVWTLSYFSWKYFKNND